ncbi:MAG: hypothetical protein HOV83_11535 [Catenulispora sp.]|nr:hypothetical protein [Catenulispora sp.]
MTSTTMIQAVAATSAPSSERSVSPWWKFSFTRTAWSRTLFVVAAAPAGLVALVDGGRLQQRAARAWGGQDIPASRTRALLALPVAGAALFLLGYVASLALLNIGYPLRPLIGMPGYDRNAWGGPTYAGVWAVHGLGGGVPAALILPWLARPFAKLQARILGAR